MEMREKWERVGERVGGEGDVGISDSDNLWRCWMEKCQSCASGCKVKF
jgi:hypothetical protein